jgi:hypothetical protein
VEIEEREVDDPVDYDAVLVGDEVMGYWSPMRAVYDARVVEVHRCKFTFIMHAGLCVLDTYAYIIICSHALACSYLIVYIIILLWGKRSDLIFPIFNLKLGLIVRLETEFSLSCYMDLSYKVVW